MITKIREFFILELDLPGLTSFNGDFFASDESFCGIDPDSHVKAFTPVHS